VVRAARPLAEVRDIRLALGAPAQRPLHGDRVPLEAALRNRSDNAVKYSPDESDVQITLRPGVTVTVEDRGRGPSDPPAALMPRFARGANAGDVLGTGLGLSIVEAAATAMGGSLTLTPRDGGGTCATLYLPS